MLYRIIMFCATVVFLNCNAFAQCPACTGYNINQQSTSGTMSSASTSGSGRNWSSFSTTTFQSDDNNETSVQFPTISLGTVYSDTISMFFTGFNIPNSKKICSVNLIVTRRYTFTGATLNATIADVVTFDGRSNAGSPGWSTTETTSTILSSGTFTPANINDGVAVKLLVAVSSLATISLPLRFYVDQIQLVVYYSDPCPLALDIENFKSRQLKNNVDLSFDSNYEYGVDSILLNRSELVNGKFENTEVLVAFDAKQSNHLFSDRIEQKIYHYSLSKKYANGSVQELENAYLYVDNRKENKVPIRYFDLNGIEIEGVQKGLIIIEYSNGEFSKEYFN